MSIEKNNSAVALGEKIRSRRHELGISIDNAATQAGLDSTTWEQYEAGYPIPNDIAPNICMVLKWSTLPISNAPDYLFDISSYKEQETWSQYLANTFGDTAAISFVIGSNALLEQIEQDLEALSHKPKGTHIGELGDSLLKDDLPQQFLTQYDYAFLYSLKAALLRYQTLVAGNQELLAHTVIDEITLYLIMKASVPYMESILSYSDGNDTSHYSDWQDWPFDIFDDEDIQTFLYSNVFLDPNHPYHFSHWYEKQFYCSDSSDT